MFNCNFTFKPWNCDVISNRGGGNGLDDDGVAELKENKDFTAGVSGFRYGEIDALRLKSDEPLPIWFSLTSSWDSVPSIGTLFQMDYVRHQIENFNVVTATYMHEEPLESFEVHDDFYIVSFLTYFVEFLVMLLFITYVF